MVTQGNANKQFTLGQVLGFQVQAQLASSINLVWILDGATLSLITHRKRLPADARAVAPLPPASPQPPVSQLGKAFIYCNSWTYTGVGGANHSPQ